MDPNACYREFCRALLEEDAEQARESYSALRAWLERGGFEPAWGVNGRRQFFTFDPRTGMLSLATPDYGREEIADERSPEDVYSGKE